MGPFAPRSNSMSWMACPLLPHGHHCSAKQRLPLLLPVHSVLCFGQGWHYRALPSRAWRRLLHPRQQQAEQGSQLVSLQQQLTLQGCSG